MQEGPPLRDVVAYQVGNATIGNEPQPGRLKLDASGASGPIASVPISIEESFSLGDSTGSVRVGAPGMASTEIAFTVRSRQSWVLLFLVAAAGL